MKNFKNEDLCLHILLVFWTSLQGDNNTVTRYGKSRDDSISIDEMERFSLSDCKKFHKEGILLLDRGRYPRMHKSFQRFKSIRYLKKNKTKHVQAIHMDVSTRNFMFSSFATRLHHVSSFNFHNGEQSILILTLYCCYQWKLKNFHLSIYVTCISRTSCWINVQRLGLIIECCVVFIGEKLLYREIDVLLCCLRIKFYNLFKFIFYRVILVL